MFAATLAVTNRTDCGIVPARAEPLASLDRALPRTSSVKRSVLATSMRFTYDALTRCALN